MKKLLNLFGQSKPASRPPRRIIEHETPPDLVYAIGDIHGCYDKYAALEELIFDDARARGQAPLIVSLGDVIDRGPDSRKVIDRMLGAEADGVERLVVSGNHEITMAGFLRAPGYTHDWLHFGGVETLESYGIDADAWFRQQRRRDEIAKDLADHIPETHQRFVADLPYLVRFGTLVFVHAGIDRRKPPARQDEADMMWRRPDPAEEPGAAPDRLLVVHGHTPGPDVFVSERRINLDTGAYAGGPLSAARFVDGRFDGILDIR